MNKWVPEQPSPWRKYFKRESCYGDRVYDTIHYDIYTMMWYTADILSIYYDHLCTTDILRYAIDHWCDIGLSPAAFSTETTYINSITIVAIREAKSGGLAIINYV